MKPMFCRFGFHRPHKGMYEQVTRYHLNGKKYNKNYIICKGCGKRLGSVAITKGVKTTCTTPS